MGVALQEHSPPYPISFLKRISKQLLMHLWQQRWNTINTGRRTFKFIPHVSNHFYAYSAAITAYLSGHGPYPSYLARFHISETDLCECGIQGDPDHFCFSCPLTSTFHLSKPSDRHSHIWTKELISNPRVHNRLLSIFKYCSRTFSNWHDD
ncbi:Retrovirus-related Pol polyprotein from type-1 retrotransposable element R1, partial [Stegodyphus mimosarum]